MTALGIVLAIALLLWASLLYVPFRWRPVGMYLFVFKVYAVALAPFIALAGVMLAVAGTLVGSWPIAVPAGIAAMAAFVAVVCIGAVRGDLTGAFGAGWAERISAERRAGMVRQLWSGRLRRSPEPRLRQNVAFATVPRTDRVLLCDVWQPPAGISPSGIAMVYLHGSAYYILDKDVGTRPLFRHLAAQGHVVVDVAYRLFPETDVAGMVGDAKRAVAWTRTHASELEIDPARVVLAGGSAGGHLALLAAYTHDDPTLTPPELVGFDSPVCAVASLYGQVDLAAMYDHTSQAKVCHPDDPQPDWDAPPPGWVLRLFGPDAGRLHLQLMTVAGRCDWLVGGTPTAVPDRYAKLSAINHVRSDGPTTLLVHGRQDEMAPVAATRRLQARLERAGQPVSALYLPHTDHAFDVFAPVWSPAARAAIHILERFLAVLASSKVRSGVESGTHAAAPTRALAGQSH